MLGAISAGLACGGHPVAPSLTGAASNAGPAPPPALPLHVEGRYVVDRAGARFKIAGVSWYGAESADFVVGGLDRLPLATIAREVRELGFNTVRLPWSNALVARDPAVDPTLLAANLELVGATALELLDAVIAALAREGLVVILDNHTSDAIWCCSETDDNGLWWNDRYPEQVWVEHWRRMARRYRDQPAVVGVELRNELRRSCAGGACEEATWGDGGPLDWRRAATRAGDAVLEVHPDLLVLIDGLAYASDLRGAYAAPVSLAVPGRLVYAAHDYAWFHPPETDREGLATRLGAAWGFLITQDRPFTAPVVVTELGTCTDGRPDCGGPARWFDDLAEYLARGDIDWIYWPLNGTQSSGVGRGRGAFDFYGVLDPRWTAVASPRVLDALRNLGPPRVGPGARERPAAGRAPPLNL